ncbi:MAG: hypothetical protein A3H97_18510 [Acidobacteria bacterium RIFCSPLOWO2_02_FULL_65_29]|nr:MAG: hypothetical protein A3H97_18510 [Acidobacteria bacterium RIFCSPLOWO2_02_FULL_65_29]
MKTIGFGVLLLWACMAMAAHVEQPSVADSHTPVRILVAHAEASPMTFLLRAETAGLKSPLQFRWSLGNGGEWQGPQPPPQTYDGGRYDVMVTVTDADGLIRKTSLTIEVEGEHQH